MTRTIGDWILTGLALALLVLFGVFLWWFGPWYASLGFGLWAILTAPLLVFAHRRTRRRSLVFLALGLIPSGVVMALLTGSIWFWGEEPALTVNALAASFPPALTVAWLRQLGTPSDIPGRRIWNVARLLVVPVVLIGMVVWARADITQPRPNTQYADRFAGCYEIHFGPWIPSTMLGHAAQGIVPQRIRLAMTRDGSPAWPFEPSALSIHPGWDNGSAYWFPTDARRVKLVWHNGFNGVSLHLHRRGDELVGKAIGHTDVIGPWPEPRALVRAIPTDCSLVAPDPTRMVRF